MFGYTLIVPEPPTMVSPALIKAMKGTSIGGAVGMGSGATMQVGISSYGAATGEGCDYQPNFRRLCHY